MKSAVRAAPQLGLELRTSDTVVREIPVASPIALKLIPSDLNSRSCLGSTDTLGRPNLFPCAFALCSPIATRSQINDRSSFATAAAADESGAVTRQFL